MEMSSNDSNGCLAPLAVPTSTVASRSTLVNECSKNANSASSVPQGSSGHSRMVVAPPAGRRPDALNLGNLTVEERTPVVADSTPSSPDAKTSARNRKKRERRAKKRPKLRTTKLPIVDDPTPAQKWELLRCLQRHFQRSGYVLPRCQDCLSKPVPKQNAVVKTSVFSGPDGVRGRRSRFGSVQVCGNVNQCVFCGRKVAFENIAKIMRAGVGHLSRGGSLYLLTFTLPHSRGDSCVALYALLQAVWKRWKKNGRGRIGGGHCRWWIRVVEPMFGFNGPHIHIHLLIATDKPLGGTIVGRESDCISARLQSQVDRLLAPCDWDYSEVAVLWDAAVHDWVRLVEELAPEYLGREVRCLTSSQDFRSVTAAGGLAHYLVKAGLGAAYEMSGSLGTKKGRKGSRSVFELMVDIAQEGRWRDLELWRDYQQAVYRKPAVTRSGTTGGEDRDPFRLYLDDPEPEIHFEGDWTIEPEEEDFDVRPWLYEALWRQDLDLELLRHVERLGGDVVAPLVQMAHDYVVFSDGVTREQADRIAYKLCVQLRPLVDVPVQKVQVPP